MVSAIYDFKAIGAILAKASVLKVEPKQDAQKPSEPVYRPEEGASHIYDYADGAFPADYSCWAVGMWSQGFKEVIAETPIEKQPFGWAADFIRGDGAGLGDV